MSSPLERVTSPAVATAGLFLTHATPRVYHMECAGVCRSLNLNAGRRHGGRSSWPARTKARSVSGFTQGREAIASHDTSDNLRAAHPSNPSNRKPNEHERPPAFP